MDIIYIAILIAIALPISYVLRSFLKEEFKSLKEWCLKYLTKIFTISWNVYKKCIIKLFQFFTKSWGNEDYINFFSWIPRIGVGSIILGFLFFLSAIMLYIGLYLVLPSEPLITIPKVNVLIGATTSLAGFFITLLEGVLGLFLFRREDKILGKWKINELRRECPIPFYLLVGISIVEGFLAGIRGGVYSIELAKSLPWLIPTILPFVAAFLLLLIGVITPVAVAIFSHQVATYFLSRYLGLLLHSIFIGLIIIVCAILFGIPLFLFFFVIVLIFVLIMIPSRLILFFVELLSEIWSSIMGVWERLRK